MFYLSDDEFSQVWGTYGRGNYKSYSFFEDIPAVFQTDVTKVWNEERGKSTGSEQKIEKQGAKQRIGNY